MKKTMIKIRVKETQQLIYDEFYVEDGEVWVESFVYNPDGAHEWIMDGWNQRLQDKEVSDLSDVEREEYEADVMYYNLLKSLGEDDIEIEFATEFHHKKGFSPRRFLDYAETYRAVCENKDW